MRLTLTRRLEQFDEATSVLPVKSPAWNWLAIAMGLLAIFILVAAIIFTRAVPGHSSVAQPSATATDFAPETPTPTTIGGITNVQTATPIGTLIPVATTPAGIPTFGRFAIFPATLSISCHGSTRGPVSLQLTNSGTGPLAWNARAIEQINAQPWAIVDPASGNLGVTKSITVTVLPVPGACNTLTSSILEIQFTAPNTVPFTVTVTHD